jgi:hypothetical protein
MRAEYIYAYYSEFGCSGQLELIEFWKQRWEKEQWIPVVLGPKDAQKDPRYAAMIEKANAFPCLPNCRGFEQANFVRWLAFSQIKQAASAVADYDVFPIRHFPPKDFGGFICGAGAGGPGFIVGSPSNFSKIADDILAYKWRPDDQWAGIPHICDMRILHKSKTRYDRIIHNTELYGRTGWMTRDLVHFGNSSLERHASGTKTEKIKRILDKYYRN